MTDEEFLSADFDELLASTSLHYVITRHQDIAVKRHEANVLERVEFIRFARSVQVPRCRAKRRCIGCLAWLSPEKTRCIECGEPLPVVPNPDQVPIDVATT